MENLEKDIDVLYIDDEIANLQSFKATFRREYHIYTAQSASEAKKILSENLIHVIISDQRMPEMTGVEFFSSIIDKYPDPIRILLTGYADIDAVIDAINNGQIYKYFSKPWDEEEMKEHIRKAYDLFNLRREKEELTKKLLDINKKLEFMARQNLLS